MGIESIGSNSIYTSAMSEVYSSLYSTSSTSSASTLSSFSLDSFEISSEARELAARPAPPDFESMSNDDFRSHIIEVQDMLTEQGFDVSNIENMTDEELESLKSDMIEKGAEFQKQGPPPPPPQQNSLTSAYETTSVDLQSWIYNAMNQTFM